MNIEISIIDLINKYFPESRLKYIPVDKSYSNYYIYTDERDEFSCVEFFNLGNRVNEKYIKNKLLLLETSVDKLLSMKIHRSFLKHYPELKLEKDIFFDILYHIECLAKKSNFYLG